MERIITAEDIRAFNPYGSELIRKIASDLENKLKSVKLGPGTIITFIVEIR